MPKDKRYWHCNPGPHGLLIHVGADSTNVGVFGPIFNPGKHFRFIPIYEDPDNHVSKTDTYESLRLTELLPTYYQRRPPILYRDMQAHFDPDIENFTFGEPENQVHGKQLLRLRPGDYLFFAASLAPYVREAYNTNARGIRTLSAIASRQAGRMAKYVVGFYEVQAIVPRDNLVGEAQVRFDQNAHVKRNDAKSSFVCAIGLKDRKTILLKEALQLTYPGSPFRPTTLAKQVYGNKDFHMGFKWLCPNNDPECGLERLQLLILSFPLQ